MRNTNYEMWCQAINEYEGAICMFNNAVSDSHIDISIRAMHIAEQKVQMIRELSLINEIPRIELVIVEKNKYKRLFNRVKEYVGYIEKGVRSYYDQKKQR
jgi:hypothetical protein